MFYSRKKSRICLDGRVKATTFAAALREKPARIYHLFIYYLRFKSGGKIKTNLFLKRFGSPEKSTTFAAALREKPDMIYHSVIYDLRFKKQRKIKRNFFKKVW